MRVAGPPHRRAVSVAATAAVLALLPGVILGGATPAAASPVRPDTPHAVEPLDGDGQCTFPAPSVKQIPWSLQRVLQNQLWQSTEGEHVKVAVIDSGVDVENPQLAGAVDRADSVDLIDPKDKGHGTTDPVGHGTEVAGIIAARRADSTGFVGLAPAATIISIRQAGEDGTGTVPNLVAALGKAVNAGARVINISQDTSRSTPQLRDAVANAVAHDVVIVASAGNDGADGVARTTYPGGYDGVLAVGASDRNNERATFSQSGEFVGVAAPGVDMLSTVPGGGQCVDNGTSFAAPYVAGVATLIRAKHPHWTAPQVIAQIEQTAQRTSLGHNSLVGWGVVDPVRALTDDQKPIDAPKPDPGVLKGQDRVVPAALTFGDPARQRQKRIAAYVVSGMAVTLLLIVGTSVALRDRRRRS
ncbi:type VII secretion-associated serine protease mycosin [Streptomyces sp. NBC_01198]|uniref:type VII secretion-associated serine protease mycosin n=1 Tax=Streptomyces sp. NBC_01198 TaxID=2903769 RepID=UPI002E107CB0|nr:type VII secretion-associated serine protease mycosin [Streptomyces sp. NBC_01198]